MLIRYGFDIDIQLWQPTTLITAMDVHESQRNAIVGENEFQTSTGVRVHTWHDEGNKLRRLTEGPCILGLQLNGVIANSGALDDRDPDAELVPVENLPLDTLPYLRNSRSAKPIFSPILPGVLSDRSPAAMRVYRLFATTCTTVCASAIPKRGRLGQRRKRWTNRLESAAISRTFAVTLCRCLNIPARYCNGYLGDIGVPPDPASMDFNAWMEAYIGGRWYTFDPRHNARRIGRILIARGRDAADIPMITSFGPHKLTKFKVITEEIPERTALAA